MSETKAAVVQVAKEKSGQGGDNEIVLKTGHKVILRPVAASLIDQVSSRIPDPDPPMWHNEEKGRDEPNPADPAYQKGLAAAAHQRGTAAMDAMIMFGIDLVDGVPEDTTWITKLKLLGIEIDNPDDLVELEFMFKRYIVVSPEDIRMITEVSGLSEEAIQAAEESFPG
jgi:hypothetical protein